MKATSLDQKTLQLAKINRRLFRDFIKNGVTYSQERLITLNARAERINNYARNLIEIQVAEIN